MMIQKQWSKSLFPANLDRHVNTTMFFVIEEVEETILDFSQGAIELL